MILTLAPNVFPHQAVLLAFQVQEIGDAFQVKISADEVDTKFDLETAADFDALFVFLNLRSEKAFPK